MNAQTNLFHPNTRLEFHSECLVISVSLCVSKRVGEYMYHKVTKGTVTKSKNRVVYYLTYSTKNYSKENIISIQRFLLSELMITIRNAKCDLLEIDSSNIKYHQQKLKFT